MKKATWRYRTMATDVKRVVTDAPSLAEAARRLDVDVATLHRWCREGKLERPARKFYRGKQSPSSRQDTARNTGVAPDTLPSVPAGTWAESVRSAYALSKTDDELVSLAEMVLAIAKDPLQRPADRLSAVAKFGAVVKQLNLEIPEHGETEATHPQPWPKRAV
jgi:transposase-like protein